MQDWTMTDRTLTDAFSKLIVDEEAQERCTDREDKTGVDACGPRCVKNGLKQGPRQSRNILKTRRSLRTVRQRISPAVNWVAIKLAYLFTGTLTELRWGFPWQPQHVDRARSISNGRLTAIEYEWLTSVLVHQSRQIFPATFEYTPSKVQI